MTFFSFGYVVNDILRETNIKLIDNVYAEVNGMDYRELRRDRDFRRAVQDIVEGCGGSGFVNGNYVYSLSSDFFFCISGES